MDSSYKDLISIGSSIKITLLFIFVIIILIILYISNQLNKQDLCPPLLKAPLTTIGVYSNKDIDINTPISNLYIQTAYNCCCKGNFKNDYVDIEIGKPTDFCALKNCALMGARALDFTVYLINGKPAISASSNSEVNYKEMYNHIDFNTAMLQVNRFFLFETNSSFVNDPLFLIFRIQSNNKNTYDAVAASLAQVFGVGNSYGNLIYNKKIDANTTLSHIQNNRVIIIVQPTSDDVLKSSTLNGLTAYALNADSVTRPCINRKGDDKNNLNDPNIHIFFPDINSPQSGWSKNTDPSPFFKLPITFIGMNYQSGLDDKELKKYIDKFGTKSIIKQ